MGTGGSKVRCKLQRYGIAATIATLGLISTSGQAAALISGSFAGTAANSQNFTPPFGNFDGSTITGTFLLDLTDCVLDPGPGPTTGGCSAVTTSFLKPIVPGFSIVFGQPDTFVKVTNTTTTQRLSITYGFMNPYVQADLELVGGVNAFVDGSDYRTLRAGLIDLTRSTLSLRGGRSYGTNVALASFTLDQPVAGVPDAPTWAMLLTGFAMTGMTVRKRTRQTA